MSLNLYIPCIASNISEKRIRHIFHYLEYGQVGNIEFIENNDKKKSAYIYFDYWYDTEESKNLQKDIQNSKKPVEIIYDTPFIWHALILNKNNKN